MVRNTDKSEAWHDLHDELHALLNAGYLTQQSFDRLLAKLNKLS